MPVNCQIAKKRENIAKWVVGVEETSFDAQNWSLDVFVDCLHTVFVKVEKTQFFEFSQKISRISTKTQRKSKIFKKESSFF